MDSLDAEPPTSYSGPKVFTKIGQLYQTLLDKSTPHFRLRWLLVGILYVVFLGRVIYLQGWYIVAYAVAIYHLNLLLAFLTPKLDPRFESLDDEGGEGPSLPTSTADEFRPFVRRLPEFKFWHNITRSTLIGTICTFFSVFNVPVFWPILVMYFFMLFFITMKRQIMHMIKYKYVPFTRGKPRYASVATAETS